MTFEFNDKYGGNIKILLEYTPYKLSTCRKIIAIYYNGNAIQIGKNLVPYLCYDSINDITKIRWRAK